MKVEYNIMNHYKRDISAMLSKMEEIGREVKVFTDKTDYGQTRDINRYKGLNDNFFNLINDDTDADWKILFHDDISISRRLVDNIEHILKYTPDIFYLGFYNPTNLFYKKSTDENYNIAKYYNHLWFQCSAWNTSYLEDMDDWIIMNTHPTIGSEDVKVQQYSCIKEIPRYSVIPSLVQHDGYDKSVFKTPAKVGRNFRNSANYNPNFDAKEIDWKEAFDNPIIDNSKTYYKEGLNES